MGIAKIISAGAVIAVAMSGCSPSYNWVGDWSGKRDTSAYEGVTPGVAHTLATIKLTINPNGTFTILEGGIPKEGDYVSSGGKLILKPTRIMDRPVEALGEVGAKMKTEMELEAISTDKVLFRSGSDPQSEPVSLARESQP